MSLSELRKKIDSLDEKIVRMLNARANVALEIGKLKHGSERDVYVPAREQKVFSHVRDINKGPIDSCGLTAIYREIMSSSLALEKDIQIAYLGPDSTFTHQAARNRFGSSVKMVPCETISDVFGAVEKDEVDYGVVPIENSTEGAVTHTFDEFVATPLKICAEIYLRISHHLMARVPMKQIKLIVSNPQVFGQCRGWLQKKMPGVVLSPVTSTARAAEMASKQKNTAALAGALAAEMYGLKVLASNIQDMGGNMTRFLVIGKKYGEASGNDKSSILFSVKHKAGTLYNALGALKKHGLNMTKIESRPNRVKPWEYFFFVDIQGHVDDPVVSKALRELNKHCAFMTVLGAYPCEKAE